jgi:small subunit ribosomal protein S8
MTLNDPLSNMMSRINNGEKSGKSELIIKPSSKIMADVLRKLQENLYVGEFQEITTTAGKSIKLNLIHKINKCGSIKPRFAVASNGFEKFEKRYLIAKDFGIILVSTTAGIMTHNEAEQKGLGGRLIAYCY